MEIIKLVGVSQGGKLTVDIPKELDNKELEIMVISSKDVTPGSDIKTHKMENDDEVDNSQMI